MATDTGKRLFHAIVIAGAALGGCEDDATEHTATVAGSSAPPVAGAPAAGTGGSGGIADVSGSGGTGGVASAIAGAGGAMAGAGGATDADPPETNADEDAGIPFPHITA